MKFNITFKSPDVNEMLYDLSIQNIDMHKDDISDMVRSAIQGWVRYGEYITVEFDTETNQAVVLKSK